MNRSRSVARTRIRSRRKASPDKPPVARLALAGRSRNVVLCALLIVLTIAVYSPALGNAFVREFDDGEYVTANPHAHGGLAWSRVKWAFTSFHALKLASQEPEPRPASSSSQQRLRRPRAQASDELTFSNSGLNYCPTLRLPLKPYSFPHA